VETPQRINFLYAWNGSPNTATKTHTPTARRVTSPFRAFFWFPVFGQFKNFLPQSLSRVWTLESGPNISRLRAHPEGLEMLSLAARCATVEVEVIAEVSLRYSGPTMQAVQDSWMALNPRIVVVHIGQRPVFVNYHCCTRYRQPLADVQFCLVIYQFR
jgi:hypothetical protein